MLVTHGSWITATIANLLDLDPDGMNALGAMRNACWCRLKVRHSVNGQSTEQPLWELEEYNKAPAIADCADWENGPADLRGPHMPGWQPIVGCPDTLVAISAWHNRISAVGVGTWNTV